MNALSIGIKIDDPG